MGRYATVQRIVVCAVAFLSIASPMAARAETEASRETKLARMQMPGRPFRQRNQLSLNAVTALSFIMRSENVDNPQYLVARKVVTDEVAVVMKLDAAKLHASWSRAPRDHQVAVLAAITQLNVRYVEGKEDPYFQMDCSGLQWYSWRTAGVDMPRQAVSQLDRRMRVEREKAIVGDVVGEGTHVHMYLGQGLAFIHAPFNGKKVKFKTMSETQARRVAWTDPSHIATYRL